MSFKVKMAAKSRIWDCPLFKVSVYKLLSFFDDMYLFFLAPFSEGMSFNGIVEHFRKFID